jgi:hypothetical protein
MNPRKSSVDAALAAYPARFVFPCDGNNKVTLFLIIHVLSLLSLPSIILPAAKPG